MEIMGILRGGEYGEKGIMEMREYGYNGNMEMMGIWREGEYREKGMLEGRGSWRGGWVGDVEGWTMKGRVSWRGERLRGEEYL